MTDRFCFVVESLYSTIIDSWGTRLGQPPAGEGVAFGEVDLAAQRELRERLPVLAQRRPDLYEPS